MIDLVTQEIINIVRQEMTAFGITRADEQHIWTRIADLFEQMGQPVTEIKVIEDVSKNGRNFIRCEV